MHRFLPVALCGFLGLPACLEIDGGAVEVAWVLRDSRQRAAKCDGEGLRLLGLTIDRIRLRIQPVTSTGAVGDDLCEAGTVKGCEFSCQGLGGTTPFNIPVPAGEESWDYFFSLVPLTADGSPIGPEIVALPPPLRRTVRAGDLTDLGLWEIVIPAKEELP